MPLKGREEEFEVYELDPYVTAKYLPFSTQSSTATHV
jgi:hypothetical protein